MSQSYGKKLLSDVYDVFAPAPPPFYRKTHRKGSPTNKRLGISKNFDVWVFINFCNRIRERKVILETRKNEYFMYTSFCIQAVCHQLKKLFKKEGYSFERIRMVEKSEYGIIQGDPG